MSRAPKCFALVVMAVCPLSPALAGETPFEGDWRLVRLQGQAVDAGGTLVVKDGHVSGSTGCNRFRASFEATSSTIKIAPVAATNAPTAK